MDPRPTIENVVELHSDLAAAEDELSAAEDRLAAAERSRDVATELIGSLEEQLNAARHRVRDSGRQIADARRRRDGVRPGLRVA